MDILKWRTAYETGVSEMDEQHKKLITTINVMYRIVRDSDTDESMDGVLAQINEYASVHLKDEEALLVEHGYPDLDAHVALHNEYKEKIESLSAEVQEKHGAANKNIYLFLRDWWVNHIVKEDKEYGSFLNEKGVK